MSFKRQKPRGANRAQRATRVFEGYHGGAGRTDQPASMWYGEDMHPGVSGFGLREGRTQIRRGLHNSVDALFEVSLGHAAALGMITDGVLSIQPVSELIT